MQKQVILIADGQRLILPVTPSTIAETSDQEVQRFDTFLGGEIAVLGKPKLKVLKFSSFFPAIRYPYVVVSDLKDPSYYIKQIQGFQQKQKPVRVIVTGTSINYMFSINNFECTKSDGTGNWEYSISFIEYKQLNVPPAKNIAPVHPVTKLKERPAAAKPKAKPKKSYKKKKTYKKGARTNRVWTQQPAPKFKVRRPKPNSYLMMR